MEGPLHIGQHLTRLGANWGASTSERGRRLACDELSPHAPVRLDRAITVDAAPATVFRRLCQLKLAPYSYDAIDNFGRRSPRELVAGCEQLAVGERFMTIFELTSFAYDKQITMRSRRTTVTYATDEQGDVTRLSARVLFEPPGGGAPAALVGGLLAVGDLVMMRKQLLTLKALAERDERER
jgi:hypothetical protein